MNHMVKVIITFSFSYEWPHVSLITWSFDFISAENSCLVRQYKYTMLNKTSLLHHSFGPCVLLSLSLSLSFSGWSPGAQRPCGFTFLPGLLRPSREGALCLHPLERAPEAFVNRASPAPGALLAFCVNQGISASFSLPYSFSLFFIFIFDPGPPGPSPL